jgi:shikimate 5-dehydrogenase
LGVSLVTAGSSRTGGWVGGAGGGWAAAKGTEAGAAAGLWLTVVAAVGTAGPGAGLFAEGGIGETAAAATAGRASFFSTSTTTTVTPTSTTTNRATIPTSIVSTPIDLPRLPRPAGVYDMIYTPSKTALLRQAAALGVPHADGLSMLVHQGARSLEIWSGASVPVAAMQRAARQALGWA